MKIRGRRSNKPRSEKLRNAGEGKDVSGKERFIAGGVIFSFRRRQRQHDTMRNHKMILAFVLSLNCVLAMPAEDMASNNDATNDTLSEGTKMFYDICCAHCSEIRFSEWTDEEKAFDALRKDDLTRVQDIFGNSTMEINDELILGRTPLWLAAFFGHEDIVEWFLNATDVEVNKGDVDGVTPLAIASWAGHVEIVQLLLERSEVDVNKAMDDAASLVPGSEAIIRVPLEIVLEIGCHACRFRINSKKNCPGCTPTPLYGASEMGRTDVVRELLSRSDIEVNKARSDQGTTPLSVASENGRVEVIRLLLDHADIDVNQAQFANVSGATPLWQVW